MLYIVDISEQCGYSIAQQAALFHSIKPLFANKPLLIVANKVTMLLRSSVKSRISLHSLASIFALLTDSLYMFAGDQ